MAATSVVARRWLLFTALVVGLGTTPLRGQSERPDPIGVFRALGEIDAAVREEAAQAEGRDMALILEALGRPVRTVRAPQLDSEGLDRLLRETEGDREAVTAERMTDTAFARRVWLDLAGRIPTADELDQFLGDPASDKRARLIDRLLASDDFAQNWARYWRDVICSRATNQLFQRGGVLAAAPLERWLTGQIRVNRPWDEVVTELLTATGSSLQDGHVTLALAHADQFRISPVELAGEVSRIFMGIQIQCAECHDHKTDNWTRSQFHEFAAFFAGGVARREGEPGAYRGFAISTSRAVPHYSMPDLEDPGRSIPVEPAFFLTEPAVAMPFELTPGQRREVAASYVVGVDNPWFARAFVNRVWYELMGWAFFLPVDDLGPLREPVRGEVLDALAEEFRAGGHDVRWLFKTIVNSAAYQSQAQESGVAARDAVAPTPIRADALLDSLTQVLSPTAAGAGDRRFAPRPNRGFPGGMPGLANLNQRVQFHALFGVDPSIPHDEVMGTIPQALFLMNSPALNGATEAQPFSALGRLLAAHTAREDALEALYVRALSRHPSPAEIAICARYIARVGDDREAFEDIFWSLINTTEFATRP